MPISWNQRMLVMRSPDQLCVVRDSEGGGGAVGQLRSRRDCMITADISSTDFVEELRNGTRLRR